MQESPYDSWKRIVESFTARDITYPSDRLPALEGIAADFSSRLNNSDMTISHDNIRGSYYYGLWLDDLPRELLWKLRIALPTPPDTSNAFHAPSWSWASLNQDVSWYASCFQQHQPSTPTPEHLLSAFTLTPLQSGKYGLRLTGKLLHFSPTQPWTNITPLPPSPQQTPILNAILATHTHTLEFSLDQSYVEETTPRDPLTKLHHNSPGRAHVYLERTFFMPLIRSRERDGEGRVCSGVLGLVVAPVVQEEDQEPRIGVYRRVGTGHVYVSPDGAGVGAEEEWFDGWRERWQRGIERWRYDGRDGEGNYSIIVV